MYSNFASGPVASMSSSHSLNSSMLDLSFSRRGKGFGGEAAVILSNGMSHSLEPYGLPLPAMVRGALSCYPSSASSQKDRRLYSCRMEPDGWCRLVWGRKLYIWRHTQDISKKSSISCRELSLPPSELPHNAKLINVLPTSSSSAPACIAVSPEGHITFWPNISNESTTVSINADIPGQECDSLTSVWPIGCILTTTSSTVLVIKKSFSGRGNKPLLTCSVLGIQKGWLGGWGKKVSTMLFNPIPVATSGLQCRAKVVPLWNIEEPAHSSEKKVFVFQGSLFQTWVLTADTNTCTSEVNVDEQIRRQFWENVWSSGIENRGDGRGSGIQAWIFDAAVLSDSKSIAVLAGAKSQCESIDNLVFGVVIFQPTCIRQRETWRFISVVSSVIQSTPAGSDVAKTQVESEQIEQLYSWRLLASHNYFYVLAHECVYTVPEKLDGVTDCFEISQLGAPIVGAGNISTNGVALLIPKHGFLVFKPCSQGQDGIGSIFEDTYNELRVPEHLALSMNQSTIIDAGGAGDDITNRYKSAFLLYIQKKQEESLSLLEELFPNQRTMCPHDPLDISTEEICKKLIDDAPASDPRWAATLSHEDDQVPHRSKILIRNFLLDKREGVELFFGFLHSSGISKRLHGIVKHEVIVATASLLYNLYEKVYFALSLQAIQSEPSYRQIIDNAIKSIVLMRKETKTTYSRTLHLSSNDIFYKSVSRVHQVIPAIISIEEEEITTMDTADIPPKIFVTNEIILRSVLEVQAAAIQPGEKLAQIRDFLIKPLLESDSNQYEVQHWIMHRNIHASLMKQRELTVKHGIQSLSVDPAVKLELIKQLQLLTDLILDTLKSNLDSISHSSRYDQKKMSFESLRNTTLRHHLEIKDYDGACQLAEKYYDFDMMAIVCYDTGNFEKLTDFFHKYDQLEFPEFIFEWYVRQKKSSELIDTFSKGPFADRLKRFLVKYPHIAWHHDAVTEDFGSSAEVLRHLAEVEEQLADDKKFYLCMSKLASLASGSEMEAVDPGRNEFIEDIDKELDLLEFQNRLSDDILNSFGLDRTTMRVLSASEMIDMYTTDDVVFDPQNFTSALGLSDFMINEDLRDEKRMLIASRAIKRDSWAEWSTDHPEDIVPESCLFKYLQTALKIGWNLNDAYPLEGILIFPEMNSLVENPSVVFLLKACYEYVCTFVSTHCTEIQ